MNGKSKLIKKGATSVAPALRVYVPNDSKAFQILLKESSFFQLLEISCKLLHKEGCHMGKTFCNHSLLTPKTQLHMIRMTTQ